MSRTPAYLTPLAALLLTLAVAAPVRAQIEDPPPLDVAVGLAYMHEEWLDRDLKFGWMLSVQRHLTPTFAVVAEGSGSYARVEPFPAFIPYSMWVHGLLGGGRVQTPSRSRVTLFGQALAGWVRRTRTNPGSILTPANEGEVNTLGIQPGGGVEYHFTRRTAIRFQGEYRILKKTKAIPESTSEPRIFAGFVFGAERKP